MSESKRPQPFYLPPPSNDARPEDVANTVAYYAKQAGVTPNHADYARAGYWSAIGRDNDYRIARGGCIRGNEGDKTWVPSWPTPARSVPDAGDQEEKQDG